MATNTWTGLTPENDEKWEQLYDEYVPSMGTAQTVGGEILRAMARIIYRFYNDGDMVGVGYGNETCNSSDRYLCDAVPGYLSLDGFSDEHRYEEAMKRNHRICFEFLQDKPEVFEQENTDDSRTPSEEDYRREREEEEPGGWWDEPDEAWEDEDFFEGDDEEDGERYSLVGVDGNAYAVMGYVVRAMRETGFSQEEIKAYQADAQSDDYDHLLCVSCEMIDKCNERC